MLIALIYTCLCVRIQCSIRIHQEEAKASQYLFVKSTGLVEGTSVAYHQYL
jgi:hypothetical protein